MQGQPMGGTIIPTARASGARVDKQNQTISSSWRFWRLVRRLSRYSKLRIGWRECCNLSRRIGWAIQIDAVNRFQADEATLRWVAEALIPAPESRQSACIAYIEKTLASHPFLSSFDTLLLTKSWIAGSEWADRSKDRLHSPQNEGDAHPSETP